MRLKQCEVEWKRIGWLDGTGMRQQLLIDIVFVPSPLICPLCVGVVSRAILSYPFFASSEMRKGDEFAWFRDATWLLDQESGRQA